MVLVPCSARGLICLHCEVEDTPHQRRRRVGKDLSRPRSAAPMSPMSASASAAASRTLSVRQERPTLRCRKPAPAAMCPRAASAARWSCGILSVDPCHHDWTRRADRCWGGPISIKADAACRLLSPQRLYQ